MSHSDKFSLYGGPELALKGGLLGRCTNWDTGILNQLPHDL